MRGSLFAAFELAAAAGGNDAVALMDLAVDFAVEFFGGESFDGLKVLSGLAGEVFGGLEKIGAGLIGAELVELGEGLVEEARAFEESGMLAHFFGGGEGGLWGGWLAGRRVCLSACGTRGR